MYSSVIHLAKKLVRIPSISPLDLGCQNIIAKRLLNLGFVVEYLNINDTKNMWAYRIFGKGKHINFLGHTDVVPIICEKNWHYPPFSATIKNGLLYGRGICDMKGAIAAMIIALENFIKKKLTYNGKISFLFTSDEESIGTNGIKKVVEILASRKEKIDYCIVGEPTSNNFIGDVIKIGRRGSITFTILIKGISGHVAYPQFVINPIHILSPILLKLTRYIWDKGNKHFPPTSLQITKIFSNSNSSNTTPGEVFLEFNIRFSNQLNFKKIKRIVRKFFASDIFNCDIQSKVYAVPFLTVKSHLIDIVIKSINKFNKFKPIVSTSGGTSDGRYLFNLTDQVVELGLINKSIHKDNEYSKVSDLHILSLMYEEIMKKIL
ncbi:succinyl-diaminopimelate desuccinylase [Buchnera aphidicola (Mollitrichosiphum nigrofasciatum)]|uniref:succinyl-diaminopimelate desuccinylase n=1 Tax=Buchnera aphidicola TaxID=9 RepID=UPI0031B85605